MSVPGAASVSPLWIPRSEEIADERRCRAVQLCWSRDIKPRDIITREALENAIAVVLAMGGSTNAVLHLLAIASRGQRSN